MEGLQCFDYDVKTFAAISGRKAQALVLEMQLNHPSGNGTKLPCQLFLRREKLYK